jgi:hypothetical protein
MTTDPPPAQRARRNRQAAIGGAVLALAGVLAIVQVPGVGHQLKIALACFAIATPLLIGSWYRQFDETPVRRPDIAEIMLAAGWFANVVGIGNVLFARSAVAGLAGAGTLFLVVLAEFVPLRTR